MIKTDRVSLEAQLNQLSFLNLENDPYIAIIQEIDPVDPIDVYAHYNHKKGERFYWSNANGDTTFVGVGVCDELAVHATPQRFEAMQAEIDKRRQRIHVLGDEVDGTGPIYFGGFSFFNQPHKEEWQSFQENYFVLPKQLLTVKDGRYFVTCHMKLDEESTVANIKTFVEQQLREIDAVQPFRKQQSHRDAIRDPLTYVEWEQLIESAVAQIQSSPLDKVVLAREVEAIFDERIALEDVLHVLTDNQQHSYVFVMEQGEDAFIGASPERLVSVEQNIIYSACLAGTTSRGETLDEDDLKAWQLLHDEKNLEEHRYVVKMIEQAVQPLCDNLDVPDDPVIYPLTTIQHLYTPVKGELTKGVSLFDVLSVLHPTPALGGEPRQEAMAFIESNEPIERGWYAAPIGWFDRHLNGEFAVAIRSSLVSGQTARLFAGCGIVADSDAEAEYDETNLKLTPMLDALGGQQDGHDG
ncbi:menaquinone-specific isochorismate synthase [Alkalibacillus flavidus]|uniref:Isochorismate synthase MenF n=1 Tax=Alkalibacillus flavidus TaxID=546021 RepID=A0ABV2KYH7_9BACI